MATGPEFFAVDGGGAGMLVRTVGSVAAVAEHAFSAGEDAGAAFVLTWADLFEDAVWRGIRCRLCPCGVADFHGFHAGDETGSKAG